MQPNNSYNQAKDSMNGAKDAAKDFADTAKSSAKDAIKDVKSAGEKALSASDVQTIIANLRDGAADVTDRSEGLIKKYPFTTVLGAAAVGALVGSLFSRARH